MNGLPIKRAVTAVLLIVIMVLGGSLGYYILSNGGFAFSDCLYMAVNAITTTGFKEAIPVSQYPTLKIYTIILMLMGMGTLLYLLSIVTAFIVEGELNMVFRRRRMNKELGNLDRHYIICGIGHNGERTILRMLENGFPIAIIDRSEEKIREFFKRSNIEAPYVAGDASEEGTLQRAGISKARGLVAALPEDQDNIFLVLTARQMNPGLRIVSKVNEDSSKKKLRQVGANALVFPGDLGGRRLFAEMVRPGIVSFMDQILPGTNQELVLEEVLICKGSVLADKKIRDTEIRSRFNLLIIGVIAVQGGGFIYNPGPDFLLAEGMTLIVIGPRESIISLQSSCPV